MSKKLKGWSEFPSSTSKRLRAARRKNERLWKKSRTLKKRHRNALRRLVRQVRFDGSRTYFRTLKNKILES